jgi:hypothetical protein
VQHTHELGLLASSGACAMEAGSDRACGAEQRSGESRVGGVRACVPRSMIVGQPREKEDVPCPTE